MCEEAFQGVFEFVLGVLNSEREEDVALTQRVGLRNWVYNASGLFRHCQEGLKCFLQCPALAPGQRGDDTTQALQTNLEHSHSRSLTQT